MTVKDRPTSELLAEIEDLRFRLEEAEETLRAIGSGEVDAIVVSGQAGDQVFTLKGAEHPYRVLVETINEGAANLSADGTILYCNQRLASALEVPLERLLGTRLESYVDPKDGPLFLALIAKSGERCDGVELDLKTAGGGLIPVLLSCSAHALHEGGGLSVVVTDLRQKKRNEEIFASERLARSIIEQAGEAILVCDAGGTVIQASHLGHKLCGENPLLKRFDDLFRLRIADTECIFSVVTPLSGGSLESVEVEFCRSDGEAFNLLLNATPLRTDQNGTIGCVVTLTDFTERKLVEDSLRESEAHLLSANLELRAQKEDLQAQREELQAQREELQAQSEELRNQSDQLQSQNRELERLWEESKRTGKELQKSRELLRTVIDNTPALVYLVDREKRFLVANKATATLFGTTPEELFGRSRHGLLPEEAARQGEASSNLVFATGSVQEFEESAEVDGKERTFLTVKFPVCDADGEVAAVGSVSWDITARKLAEKALRESEERLALALEGGGMGLWEWDVRKDQSVWNAREYELLGLPPGEGNVSSRTFFDRVRPEDLGPFNKILAEVIGNGSEFNHEIRIIRADDGQERWLAATGRLQRDVEGQPTKMLGVNYDITARKRAEEALKQMNDELERRVALRTAELEANIETLKVETEQRLRAVEALREKEQMLIQQSRQAAMGEMIGNIAHQWRQPLNALGLTIQNLELNYEYGEFNKAYLRESVATSMKLIKHMSRTIDDFRNFFRPDKEKAEFQASVAVSNALALIKDSFESQGIEIEVELEDDPVIYGYRNELAQVLLNILNNARDVLTERKIEAPRVKITVGTEGGRSSLTITDNAGGVPEEIIGKIFDPYFTTKGPQEGTGLGLFMSKTIVEKNMEGRLTVRNLPEGAQFRIEV